MKSLEQPGGVRPDLRRELESLRLEIRKLWATQSRQQTKRRYDQPFSLPGIVYVSESGPWYPPNFGGKLVAAVVGLGQAGSTQTTVRIRMNGQNIPGGNIIIPPGVTKVLHQNLSTYASGDSDFFTVGVTQAGAGASNLTVQLRLLMT